MALQNQAVKPIAINKLNFISIKPTFPMVVKIIFSVSEN